MQRSNKFFRYVPPGILVTSLLLIYLNSMAPGLSWANSGADGGDLITAAATGGIAHPTGYPVYLLLARLFQLVPIGSLAYRTNLMSALAAVITALLVYHLVIRSILPANGNQNWLPGLASAFAFGLAPLIWSQAVITEVYTLHALFSALILYLACVDLSSRFESKRLDRYLGITFGLAMGNHVTTILLLPALLTAKLFRKSTLTDEFHPTNERKEGLHSLWRRLVWLGYGLLAYLILPLRAFSHPSVNWGNPVRWSAFAWLVSGKLYQDQLFVLTLSSIGSRVREVAGLLIEQFGLPGLMLGLIGLVVFYQPSRLYINMIWVIIVFISFAVIYATHDSFIYLIPAFLCFSIWIGLGLGGIMDINLGYRQFGTAGALIFILYLFVMAGIHWPQVDASHDLRAERFGEQVLAETPANAIVFAKGDQAVFAMWYFHYALHNRPDLIVVATDLLHFDWYLETLQANYPTLNLPAPFPFAETVKVANPERPVCYIEYDISSEINCYPVTPP